MAAGFRGIGTAIKSIPLAGWISMLASGITTILSFTNILGDSTDEIDENTKAIEENNRALERGNELKKQREANLKGIADAFESLNELSQEQLKVLRSEIEAEIAATSEAEKSIKVAENQIKKFNEVKDTLGPLAEAKKQVSDIQNQLNERDEEGNFIIKSGNRERLRKELAAQQNILKSLNQETFQKNKLQKEGIDINEDETARLEDLRKKLEEVNALIKEDSKDGGRNSKSRLNELAELRKKLNELEIERGNELIKNNGFETDRFKTLTDQTNELKAQIAEYERLLKLNRDNDRFTQRAQANTIQDATQRTNQGSRELGTESTSAKQDILVGMLGVLSDADKKRAEERAEEIADISNQVTNLLRANLDRRLEMLNEEEAAEQRKADAAVTAQERIIAAREAGVDSQSESLAFEKKAEAEALAEQERIQKRKQRLQLFNAGIEAFNAQVQQGSTNAAGSTISQLGTLLSFLSAIPAFWEGTETTVGDSLGNKVHSGRDGILARVDKDEIILNKEKSDKLKGLTTDQITNYALMYQNGVHGMERRSITAIPTFSDPKMYQQLKENNALLKTIANKPVIDNSAEIVGKVLHFIKKETSTGKTTTTIHKTRLR